MRKSALLGSGPGFAVYDVLCSEPASSWAEPELSPWFCLVLVRTGVFRRRTRGVEQVLDPTVGYLQRLGEEEQFAHPTDEPDRCTAIRLDPALLGALTGDAPDLPYRPIRSEPGLDLAHRLLVARRGGGRCTFGMTERVVRLVAGALGQAAPERVTSGRPATAGARARIVDVVRAALAADPVGLGLVDLARLACVSPHHLSRIFHAETGLTVTRYRNRLRVRLALERLDADDTGLAQLAADLGFADHAHLTRALRRELGHPPSALRRRFAHESSSAGS